MIRDFITVRWNGSPESVAAGLVKVDRSISIRLRGRRLSYAHFRNRDIYIRSLSFRGRRRMWTVENQGWTL